MVRGKASRGTVSFEWFFDRDRVRAMIGAANEKYLGMAGFRVRGEARKSIKKKGKARAATAQEASARAKTAAGKQRAEERWQREVRKTPSSAPGTPPHTHTGFLRDDIVYAYDPGRRSVVIGTYRSKWLGRLHEHGGTRPRFRMVDKKTGKTILVYTGRIGAGWNRWMNKVGAKAVPASPAKYPARPYMAPALKKVEPKLPALWARANRSNRRAA